MDFCTNCSGCCATSAPLHTFEIWTRRDCLDVFHTMEDAQTALRIREEDGQPGLKIYEVKRELKGGSYA